MNQGAVQPTISLVLPTYNVGNHIDRCIDSCVKQTYQNIEIIVVDDGGHDDAIERAKKWAARDRRVNIVHNQRNLGTYHARRIGTEASSGAYILYLDPDDALRKDACELISRTACTSKPDLVFFGVRQIPQPPWYQRGEAVPRLAEQESSLHRAIVSRRRLTLGTPGKAYARSVILAAFNHLNIGIDERLTFGEDALTFFSALLFSQKAAIVNSDIYHYFRNKSSITMTNNNSSIIYKTSQLDAAIFHIRNCAHKNGIQVEKHEQEIITDFFCARLLRDKYLLLRYFVSHDGSNVYFRNVLKSWSVSHKITDLIRLTLFALSSGHCRL